MFKTLRLVLKQRLFLGEGKWVCFSLNDVQSLLEPSLLSFLNISFKKAPDNLTKINV